MDLEQHKEATAPTVMKVSTQAQGAGEEDLSQALRWIIGVQNSQCMWKGTPSLGWRLGASAIWGVSVTTGQGWGVRERDPLKWPYRRDAMVAFRWKEERLT